MSKDINEKSIEEIFREFYGMEIQTYLLPAIMKEKINPIQDIKNSYGKTNGNFTKRELIKYLIENEKYVDKEKLILANYIINCRNYNESKAQGNKVDIEVSSKFDIAIIMVQRYLAGKDVNISLMNKKDGLYVVEVISSSKILEEDDTSRKERAEERRKIIKKVDKSVLRSALIKANCGNELEQVFTDGSLGKKLIYQMIYNTYLKEGKTSEEIEKVDIDISEFEKIDPEIAEDSFSKLAEEIDIGRLFLSAFKNVVKQYEEGLYTNKEKGKIVGFLIDFYNIIRTTHPEITIGEEKYNEKHAVDELEQVIKSIIKPENKDKCVIIGNMNEVSKDLTKKCMKKYGKISSAEELMIFIQNRFLSLSDIIEMYERNVCTLDQIIKTKEETHLEGATRNAILNLLNKSKGKNINTYITIYRNLYIENQSEEVRQIEGRSLINRLGNQPKITKLEKILDLNLMTQSTFVQLAIEGIIEQESCLELYLKGKIGIDVIKNTKCVEVLFSDEKLINAYLEFRNTEKDEEKKSENRIKLEKIVVLYQIYKKEKIAQIRNQYPNQEEKIQEEKNWISEEFLINLDDKLQENEEEGYTDKDIMDLYHLGIIELDYIISEKPELIKDIFKQDKIKPNDIKKLYNTGEINFQMLLKICSTLNLTQRTEIALAIFSKSKDYVKRMSLIEVNTKEKFLNSPNGKSKKTDSKKIEINGKEKNKIRNSEIFDTGERHEAIVSMDKEAVAEVLNDGHVIFRLSNIRNGLVIIEKFYATIPKTGEIIEAKDAAAYVMTEEEYIENKDRFIKNNQIVRKELRIVQKELENKKVDFPRRSIHTKLQYLKNLKIYAGLPQELVDAKDYKVATEKLKGFRESKKYSEEEIQSMEKTFRLIHNITRKKAPEK